MEIEYLNPDDPVELLPMSCPEIKSCISRMIKVRGEAVCLTQPKHHRDYVEVPNASRWILRYTTEEGYYQQEAVMSYSSFDGARKYLVFSLRNTPQEVLRRDFDRVHCSVDISFKVMKDKEDFVSDVIDGKLENISIGGTSIATEHLMDSGDFIALTLRPNEFPEMILTGVVVNEKRKNMERKYGIRFLGLSKEMRQNLVLYVNGLLVRMNETNSN